MLMLLLLICFSHVWPHRPHRQQPTRLPRPGILQARTLEWVAISFSNAWKWKVKPLSRVWPSASAAFQAPPSMGFSRQEYWSGVPLASPNWATREAQIVIFDVSKPPVPGWNHFYLLGICAFCSRSASNLGENVFLGLFPCSESLTFSLSFLGCGIGRWLRLPIQTKRI